MLKNFYVFINYHETKKERKEQFKYYCNTCDIETFTKSVHETHMKSTRYNRNVETLHKIL